MPVTLLCPNLKCRRVLQVPDSVRGRQVRCSYCGSLLAVPATPAPKPLTPATDGEPAKAKEPAAKS